MVVANATVDIAELKARNPLGDSVESAGVVLRGKGRVRQGVCPFHKESEGSFTVYSDTERFYCFGCGAGGDVLDFVQRMEGLTLPEAIRRLDGGTLAGYGRCGSSGGSSSTPCACDSSPRPGDADGGDKVLLSPSCGDSAERQGSTWPRGASVPANRPVRLGLGYAPGTRTAGALCNPRASPANGSGTPACSWNGARSGSPG